jgi:hypothetical protein
MNYFYSYIHIVSYYEGNNRENNLLKIVDKINNIKLFKDDSNNKYLIIFYIINNNISDDLNKYYYLNNLKNNKIDIKIIHRFNTGGTCQTLYDSYKYLINNNINCELLGVFEDDAIFNKNYILDNVKKYIEDGYIFVGSFWEKDDKPYNGVKKLEGNCNNRIVPICREYHIVNNSLSNKLINNNEYIWCEDPYITTLDNLKKIEDKMGLFTLAPKNEIYTHCEHGINYGEVGFCIRLNKNGFKFIGISKKENFCSLDVNSIGNKLV